MEIKLLDKTVKNLLETAFYRIPRFQRPYSWDQENVEDFWNDAVVAGDPDYFIGSFVLYRSKSDSDLLFIVDGQQRLTTITLLLAATRDAFEELGHLALANSMQRLIEREDINSELRLVLDSETPYPYLQERIQKYSAKKNVVPIGPEQQGLKAAFDFLMNQIRLSIKAIETDTTTTETRKTTLKKK